MGGISISRVATVAVVALVALAVWLFRKTGDPDPAHEMPRAPQKPRSRYGERVAARRGVERRMDDLRFSHGYRGGVSGLRDESMQHLSAIHAEIEAQLEALKTNPQA